MKEILTLTWSDEQKELQEIAELVKRLPPEEKKRILYRLQGAMMVIEEMNATSVAV